MKIEKEVYAAFLSFALQWQTLFGCKDVLKGCSIIKAKGYCGRKVIQKKCSLTCGVCEVTCEDKRATSSCEMLKEKFFCEKRPGAMLKNCAKTCNFCQPVTISVKPPEEANCVNVNSDLSCDYFLKSGRCHDNPAFAHAYCKKTCVCKRAGCENTLLGCCDDGMTVKKDEQGSNCRENQSSCRDDPRFKAICKRFSEDCNGNENLGESLRMNCPRTCGLCMT